ncbi:hypothetical protein F3Y22_tig00110429pilonHSYRG01402 [Hibiscus syriacus]|uniref:Uncharacterized protein n=1 Tax=Hibiscus syriacus TaxID=106335 RepID=A0A6A3ARB6_HIBSY|nr:hypothetical protein F3Y22_tig00110429pilonHSYRG01402 [Hibiscus syriacus]
METPTPTQHSEDDNEHVFLSKYPPVLVPDNLTLSEFVLQDAELYADKVAFVEAVSGKSYYYRILQSMASLLSGSWPSHQGFSHGGLMLTRYYNDDHHPIATEINDG